MQHSSSRISEERLQQEIILWWEANCEQWGAEPWELAHIPNGLISGQSIRYVKALGVRPGYPDLMIPISSFGYHGLFIELKRPESNKTRLLSNSQRRIIARLNERGYRTIVVNSLDEAIMEITAYMEGL